MFSVRFSDSLGFFAFCNFGLVLSYHEIVAIGGYGCILLLLEHALLLCQLLEKIFRQLMVNLNHMFSNPHDSGCKSSADNCHKSSRTHTQLGQSSSYNVGEQTVRLYSVGFDCAGIAVHLSPNAHFSALCVSMLSAFSKLIGFVKWEYCWM
jgi:hypothetical protein